MFCYLRSQENWHFYGSSRRLQSIVTWNVIEIGSKTVNSFPRHIVPTSVCRMTVGQTITSSADYIWKSHLHRDESGIALASSWTRMSQVWRGRPGGLVQLADGFLAFYSCCNVVLWLYNAYKPNLAGVDANTQQLWFAARILTSLFAMLLKCCSVCGLSPL